jgi:hypothetical protein
LTELQQGSVTAVAELAVLLALPKGAGLPELIVVIKDLTEERDALKRLADTSKADIANLNASHEEKLRAVIAERDALKARRDHERPPTAFPPEMVLTVDEHAALSPADQRRFRELHGTVTSNPAPHATHTKHAKSPGK